MDDKNRVNPPTPPEDDDFNFDWLNSTDADESQTSVDDAALSFDWQDSAPQASADTSGSGFTDELDWQALTEDNQPSDTDSPASAGFDWQASNPVDASTPSDSTDDELPDWLRDIATPDDSATTINDISPRFSQSPPSISPDLFADVPVPAEPTLDSAQASEDDLFADFDFDQTDEDVFGETSLPSPDPDFFTDFAPASTLDAGTLEDDFFQDFSFEDSTPSESAEFEPEPIQENDFFASLGITPDANDLDDDEMLEEDAPDWLQSLTPTSELGQTGVLHSDDPRLQDTPPPISRRNDTSEAPVQGNLDDLLDDSLFADFEPASAESDDLDSLLGELDDLPELSHPEVKTIAPDDADLETLLSGLEVDDGDGTPDTSSEDLSRLDDWDSLFADDAPYDPNRLEEADYLAAPPTPAPTRATGGTPPPINFTTPDASELATADDLADILSAASTAATQQSAAALIRTQADRPAEEMDERLQALREAGLKLSTSKGEDASASALGGIVPDLKPTLAPANFAIAQAAALPLGVQLSPEQQTHAALVERILKGEDAQSSRRQRRPSGLGRMLVSLLILVAVLLPFLFNLQIAPSPTSFSQGDKGMGAFVRLDTLLGGEQVLLAVEYGVGASYELDGLTRSLLQHIYAKRALPVLTSGDPAGILRAQDLVNASAPAEARSIITPFISGGAIGLRTLASAPASFFSNDYVGRVTGLNINKLDQFAAIIIVAEDAERVRTWLEQVLPNTNAPFVVALSYSALPLSLPYLEAQPQVQGRLVGYADSLAYQHFLSQLQPVAIIPTATNTPTITPTPTITQTPLPSHTPSITPTPQASPTSTATQTPVMSATPSPTLSLTPSNTPSETPIIRATLPPTFTPTPTFTPSVTPAQTIQVAIVTAAGGANVREEPNTNARILTRVGRNEVLRVISQSEDASWVNIALTDGRLGWISASLVRIEERQPETAPNSQAPQALGFAKRVNKVAQAQATPVRLLTGEIIVAGGIEALDTADASGEALATLEQGMVVRFLAFDDSGNWANIVLPDGRLAWVEPFALDIQERPLEALTLAISATPALIDSTEFAIVTLESTNPAPEASAEASLPAQASASPSPSATSPAQASASPTQSALVTPSASPTPSGFSAPPPNDARYNAFTLGTLVAIILIGVSNLIALVRALLGRNRS